MPHSQVNWRKVVLIYIFQLFSHATRAVHVQLIAPYYVKHHNTATLFCNHSVPESELHKIEFIRDHKKILQYIKDRIPPFITWPVNGAELEYSPDGKTIKLKDVTFEASGVYSCEVAMATPIYTKASNNVQMQVIEHQSEEPRITFNKADYRIEEYLEANCTSSPARPVPHLTWFINGKEVDVTLVTLYPHRSYKNNTMSATSKLKIQVSKLLAGDNSHLRISCQSTIPDYLIHQEQYADFKVKTLRVKMIPAPVSTSSTLSLHQPLAFSAMMSILYAMHKIIPL